MISASLFSDSWSACSACFCRVLLISVEEAGSPLKVDRDERNDDGLRWTRQRSGGRVRCCPLPGPYLKPGTFPVQPGR